MNTINFELSKRLNDLGLLDNIGTEYRYSSYNGENDFILFMGKKELEKEIYTVYKTLTLEEAIEFLPERLDIKIFNSNDKYDFFYLQINKLNGYKITYLHSDNNKCLEEHYGNTLLEAIEKMIEYLLDNNLLNK